MIADSTDPATIRQRVLVLCQEGRFDQALSLCQRLCALDPDNPDAWHIQSLIHGELRRWPEAVACARRAVVLRPDAAATHRILGRALLELGDFGSALVALDEAVALDADDAQAHCMLGNLHYALGTLRHSLQHHVEAEGAYRRAIALDGSYEQAHCNLGNVLLAQKRFDEAIACYRRALALAPRQVRTYFNLGKTYFEKREFQAALDCYRQAAALDPRLVEPNLGMAEVMVLVDRKEDAVRICEDILRQRPDHLATRLFHCFTLKQLSRYEDALTCYRQALAMNPGNLDIYCKIASIHLLMGDVSDSLVSIRKALALDPDHKLAHLVHLFTMNYDPDARSAEVLEAHRAWGTRHGIVTGASSTHPNSRDPDRSLRIGYVSPDFRTHSVAWFLESLFAQHDRNRFTIYGYSNVYPGGNDERTARLRSLCDQWRDISPLNDSQLAAMIRQDRIDLLVDLAGHSTHNRLAAFALRPAPVQIAWLGYPNITGLPAMDYRFTDAYADPESESSPPGCEQLVRLPRGFLCYAPPDDAPDPGLPPRHAAGGITFGSFNNLAKVNDHVVSAWAAILNAVPGSRLLLKSVGLADTAVREQLRVRFAAHGVAAGRLELLPQTPSFIDHLAHYRRIDIGLDTFPYNGTTTTCEALWMGVPVVSLAGDCHAGRVGVSLLSQIGLHDLIASNAEEYVSLAVALAADSARISSLRSTLRERMRASSLCDAPAFARKIEAAYRRMWGKWCAR